MDKYTVKMFPQAYRDIDKIYEQAFLVSNYASCIFSRNHQSSIKCTPFTSMNDDTILLMPLHEIIQ